ncbi:copper amine oxidase N-terminal domain-containing protein [Lysinibacillus sp. NPDC056232]|uniref:copper amine oxidase N-terminal domain-containing protein n=1 Tax=Lysinibacillus sp. NPDC056232 TaxID=3345756 RepID=UPI0035E1DBCA
MKKVFTGVFLALILIITSSPAYAAKANIKIKVDGVIVATDVNPETKNNRTMVPLRVISENLGATVNWSDSQVTLTKSDIRVILKLNSNTVVKNGQKVSLDVKPYLKNGRIFVPLRFLAETFDCNVDYKDLTVNVITKPLVINGVEVKAMLHEYHMTMGGVVEQIKGNAYVKEMHNIFVKNKGSKVKEPSNYTWSVHSTIIGGYYKGGQYDFIDQKGNSIKQFDLYTLVQSFDETLPDPKVLIYDATDNQWYLFNDASKQSIFQLTDTAAKNGFLTIIENTVP